MAWGLGRVPRGYPYPWTLSSVCMVSCTVDEVLFMYYVCIMYDEDFRNSCYTPWGGYLSERRGMVVSWIYRFGFTHPLSLDPLDETRLEGQKGKEIYDGTKSAR